MDLQQRCAISVIVTCYFEEKSLREFHSRLKAALESMGQSYEIVMINDGSTFKVYNGDILRALGYGPHKMFQNTEVIARLARYTEVPVSHAPRRYGKSGWTFTKLYRANMDNFVSMSDRPFQFVAVACLFV